MSEKIVDRNSKESIKQDVDFIAEILCELDELDMRHRCSGVYAKLSDWHEELLAIGGNAK